MFSRCQSYLQLLQCRLYVILLLIISMCCLLPAFAANETPKPPDDTVWMGVHSYAKTGQLIYYNTLEEACQPEFAVSALTNQNLEPACMKFELTGEVYYKPETVQNTTGFLGTGHCLLSLPDIYFDETLNRNVCTAPKKLPVTMVSLGIPLVKKTADPEKPEDDCGGCPKEGQSVGDPINPTTGNMYHDEVDYAVVGNSPLEFKRRHNSSAHKVGHKTFGYALDGHESGSHWRHNYSASLLNVNATQKKAVRANGQKLLFTLKSSVWSADADVNLQLSQTATGWQLIDEARQVEAYDSQGKLLSITDRKGVKVSLSYDPAGRLTKVSDPYGRTLSFVYDAGGRMTQMKSPLGDVTQYTYDTNNRLAGVVYADGTKKQYVYGVATQPDALTGIVNELGKRVATWTYDANGRATSSSNANGVDKTTITYGDKQSTVKNALGQTQEYGYELVLGQLLTKEAKQANNTVNQRAYDSNGNTIRYTDVRGSVTEYAYDLKRNLETKRTEAVGTPQARTVTTAWHGQFRLPTEVKVGSVSTQYEYDSQGNVLKLTKQDSSANKTQVWRYGYNGQGLPVTVTLPSGVVERYTYDSQGNLASERNGLNQSTAYTYDGAGRLLSSKGINGVVQQYAYDKRGRVLSVTASSQATALSPALKAVTGYGYTAAGQLSKVTLPSGQTVSYTYDDAGRLIKVSDNLGNQIAYRLDLIGNVLSTETKDGSGALSHAVSHSYDTMNRLTRASGANRVDTYAYDALGNRLSERNGLNQTTGYAYDALNRLVKVNQADSGAVQVGYTPLDQVTKVVGARNEATQYSVNGLDQRQKTVSADTGQTVYTHDANGNVLSQTDALGNKTEYTYDALNRLTSVKTKDNLQRLTYDEDGAARPGQVGRLTGVVSNEFKHRYQYDGFGRLIASSQTRLKDNQTQTTQYRYTAGGQLNQVTYPSGAKVDYQYTGGQVSSVLINGKAHLSQIKYNGLGQLVSGTFANGEKLKRTYDSSGNPTGTALASYALDAAGTIKSITSTPNSAVSATQINQSITLGYDAMNRLTNWTETYTQTPATGTTVKTTATAAYTWDKNSNRTGSVLNQSSRVNTQTASTTKNTQSLSYGAGNRLTQNLTTKVVGTVSNGTNQAITLDAAGNTKNDGFRQYTYNALNQLSSLTVAGKTTQYSYDIQNRRLLKTIGTQINRYVYAEEIGEGSTALSDSSLLGEYGASAINNKEYVYLGDTPIAVVQAGNILTVQTDHLNTPRQLTDSTKKVVWNWAYSAFGENQPTSINATTTLNLRYPGQYYDAESKLHYNINRYYDPATGRYTQSDPIGLAGGINTYTYVGGNAVGASDPRGLEKINLIDKDKDPLIWWAGKFHPNPPNGLVLIAHATSERFNYWSLDDLVKYIKNLEMQKKWKPGQPIVLNGCEAGKGKNSIAEQLSKALNGNTVVAPDSYVWNFLIYNIMTPYKESSKYLGFPDLSQPGKWNCFGTCIKH